MKLIELALILTAALIPFFILANEVSGDEFLKAAAGTFLAASTALILGIYKTWKSTNNKRDHDPDPHTFIDGPQ